MARTGGGKVIVEGLFDVAAPLITREWKTRLRLRLGDNWRLDRWRLETSPRDVGGLRKAEGRS